MRDRRSVKILRSFWILQHQISIRSLWRESGSLVLVVLFPGDFTIDLLALLAEILEACQPYAHVRGTLLPDPGRLRLTFD